jgi:biopolymer transport protein ExbD
MADIAFLLMIFYMSSAILRPISGPPVTLPVADESLRQPSERVEHVWIDVDGKVWMADAYVEYDEIGLILMQELQANPELVVALHADRRTPYAFVDRALREFKRSEAVRVSFTVTPNPEGP